jgi:uncharacterized protein YukE
MTDLSREELALTKAANFVQDAHGEMTSDTNAMPAKLSTKGSWEGGGSASFTTLVNAWTQDTQAILKALEVFDANLRGADSAYTNVDQAQTDKFNQISSRMTSQA